MEKELLAKIEAKREDMVKDLMEMISIPSINPRCGGQGEYQRSAWLMSQLEKHGIPYETFEVPDELAENNVRRSLYVKVPGSENTEKTVWFIAHIDTVNTGDLNAWETDPFKPVIKDGKIFGLSAEDNSQAVISALYMLYTIWEEKIHAKCNIGFAFVADEETGSDFGLKPMVEAGIFQRGDESVVPDMGNPEGSFIEIAEKSVFWLKFTVTGEQTHASLPQKGNNALAAGMRFAVELEDTLKATFNEVDEIYDPPYSTFEPTQRWGNVASPNVVPGKDEFCFDMRVLPQINLDDVVKKVEEVAAKFRQSRNVGIEYEVLQRSDAPKPTDVQAEVVQKLLAVLKERGIQATCGGVGGATCGAVLRRIDVPAAVWSTIHSMCHQPNEYTVIEELVGDCKVFMSLVLKYC